MPPDDPAPAGTPSDEEALAAHLGPLPPVPDDPDARWMRRCLALALHGAGSVSPNPLVGSVVVDRAGRWLGEGWHARYGGPHAEPAALADVEARHGPEAARGATLYVNLEPCSHHGKTPPCADLLVRRGLGRVVVGMADPFPAVAGRGLARLRAAGVEVRVGVLADECARLNDAFVHHVRTARPLVVLKVAQTLDGRVATRSGDSRWVTGEPARRLVHRWRAGVDGVLVGAGTAAVDDPALTVRHVEGAQPLRLVLDRTGTLPPDLRLFTDAHAARTVAVTGPEARPAYADALRDRGGRLLVVPQRDGHLDLGALFERLGRGDGLERPVQSLLVEAGPRLATALLRENRFDRLRLFVAPKLLGGGRAAFEGAGPDRMADALLLAGARWETVGDDLLVRARGAAGGAAGAEASG